MRAGSCLPRAAAPTIAISARSRSCIKVACASDAWRPSQKSTALSLAKRSFCGMTISPATLNTLRLCFKALVPHRKWWSSQASIYAAQNDEFLELAARSGCKQLFIGLESISQASLNEVQKPFNRVSDYARAIERVHSHGIAVQAGIVFGFDNDARAIFGETLDFLEATGVQNATFNILAPFPGTRLYQRLEAEGRILTRDWSKYNSRTDVVFQPKLMSPEELLAGYEYANQRFYSWRSVCRRLTRSPVGLPWTLPLNLAYGYAASIARLQK